MSELQTVMEKRKIELHNILEDIYTICQNHPDTCCNISCDGDDDKSDLCPFHGKGKQRDHCLMYGIINVYTEMEGEDTIRCRGDDLK